MNDRKKLDTIKLVIEDCFTGTINEQAALFIISMLVQDEQTRKESDECKQWAVGSLYDKHKDKYDEYKDKYE